MDGFRKSVGKVGKIEWHLTAKDTKRTQSQQRMLVGDKGAMETGEVQSACRRIANTTNGSL